MILKSLEKESDRREGGEATLARLAVATWIKLVSQVAKSVQIVEGVEVSEEACDMSCFT